jgi:hypothetical protein
MSLTRGRCLVQAQQDCAHCYGLGRRSSRGEQVVCRCVYRSIFRECYAKFRLCVSDAGNCGRVDYERMASQGGRGTRSSFYGLKKQEFAADFCLIAARELTSAEHQIFRFHVLLGADWRLCCRRLGIDRGLFWHAVYRIQEKLGRVFAELQPHALWPTGEYFSTPVVGAITHPILAIEAEAPPLAMVAQ